MPLEDTQRMAIRSVVSTSEAAIGEATEMADQETVDAADTALADLKKAIDDATELSEEDRAAHMDTYNANVLLLGDKKAARTAHMEEEEEMRMAAEEEASDDAAKLWETAINAYQGGDDMATIGGVTRSVLDKLPGRTTGLKVLYKDNAVHITLDNKMGRVCCKCF